MIPRSFALTAIAALVFLGLHVVGAQYAQARAWGTNPQAQAVDYSEITDARPNGHTRILFWLSAPTVPPANAAARQIFDRYVIIAAAESVLRADGTTDFLPVGSLQAWGADHKHLTELHEGDLPPTMQGMITGLRAASEQSLGVAGSGLHWFTFAAGSVKACDEGQLSVRFDGDTYVYDTPIPGCGDENPQPPASAPAGTPPAQAVAAAAAAVASAPPPVAPEAAFPTPAVSALAIRPHFVASGVQAILWQVVALNPDCSSLGTITFKMLKEPQHGDFRTNTAKVFPHFPPKAPLFRCDRRRVDGQVATYKARAGYVGNDYVEFETIYPSGAAFDIRVPIVVR